MPLFRSFLPNDNQHSRLSAPHYKQLDHRLFFMAVLLVYSYL